LTLTTFNGVVYHLDKIFNRIKHITIYFA